MAFGKPHSLSNKYLGVGITVVILIDVAINVRAWTVSSNLSLLYILTLAERDTTPKFQKLKHNWDVSVCRSYNGAKVEGFQHWVD